MFFKKFFFLKKTSVQEPTFWRNYFYRVSLIKQTSLGSIDSIILENEVFSKDPNEESEKIKEKQEKNKDVSHFTLNYYNINFKLIKIRCLKKKIKDKGQENLSNKEVLFDASKIGGDSGMFV